MSDITPSELLERVKSSEKLIIIDVREEWEYDEINIGGKLHPLAQLPEQLSELQSLKDHELIIHCKGGKRSNQARKFLSKNGFTNVRSLAGGIDAYLQLRDL